MIKVDGNFGEGGGAIVRTALALSTITQKPFEIYDIRKGRPQPGLKSQHLYCVRALKRLSDAIAEGDELGSTSLKYYPKKIIAKNLDVDIETAGSITLLLQSLPPPSMFASKPITISVAGGTDVKWSMPFDYFNNILLPQLQRFAKIEARLLKRGYYPKGGGKVEIRISPKFKLNDFENFEEFHNHLKQNVNPYNLTEQGNLIQIKGISHASKDLQGSNVAERQTESAKNILKLKYDVPINIISQYQETLSTGSGIALWAIFSRNKNDIDENNPIRVGADSLGERGKRAEDVGEEAASRLIKQIEAKAPVDGFLADQILPFMALVGNSKIKVSEITSHARTNIYAIEQFFGKIFEVDENNNVIKSI
ncbi:MAG TPA: RNA 3'-terminal phosphate cyclase [Candidatus Nanoarchaeia archaeon]|nr:RNA 3'-terminal phosphate cyclase [Candidatus Nanoarchaeia archaeon]